MAWEYSRWSIAFWLGLLFFLGGQAFPYGRAHTNPPVVGEPQWDSPQTRSLAKTACFDCHSNETTWPWYAQVAPASWLVQKDVDQGRAALNFSDWKPAAEGVKEAAEEVTEQEMPPVVYRMMHTEARLNAADRASLARGLARTVGSAPSADHER